ESQAYRAAFRFAFQQAKGSGALAHGRRPGAAEQSRQAAQVLPPISNGAFELVQKRSWVLWRPHLLDRGFIALGWHRRRRRSCLLRNTIAECRKLEHPRSSAQCEDTGGR